MEAMAVAPPVLSVSIAPRLKPGASLIPALVFRAKDPKGFMCWVFVRETLRV